MLAVRLVARVALSEVVGIEDQGGPVGIGRSRGAHAAVSGRDRHIAGWIGLQYEAVEGIGIGTGIGIGGEEAACIGPPP